MGTEDAGHQAGVTDFVDRGAVLLEDHPSPLHDLSFARAAVDAFPDRHLDQGKRRIGSNHGRVSLRGLFRISENEGPLERGRSASELLDRNGIAGMEQDEGAGVGSRLSSQMHRSGESKSDRGRK